MSRDKMIRKQIYLEPEQNERVKLLSGRQGKTEAEIIREAIDRYMADAGHDAGDPLAGLIGMGSSGGKDGSVKHDRDIYGVKADAGDAGKGGAQ